MTEVQLDAIETALQVTLPAAYRQTSIAFPFRPIGHDWVYWFYDDPERVIGATRAPLSDGEYDQTDWRGTFVVIGESGAGDLYLLDTPASSPVYCLSHETHRIEPEWPTFRAFVEEWLRVHEEYTRKQEAEGVALRVWWRRAWLIMGVIGCFAFILTLLILVLLPRK